MCATLKANLAGDLRRLGGGGEVALGLIHRCYPHETLLTVIGPDQLAKCVLPYNSYSQVFGKQNWPVTYCIHSVKAA